MSVITLCTQQFLYIFGTTYSSYSCGSLFSIIKIIKSTPCSNVTDVHLTKLLKTALTTHNLDFKNYTTNTLITITLFKYKYNITITQFSNIN